MRRKYEWAVGLVLLLLLAACSRPLTHAHELTPATSLPPDVPTPAPTWTKALPPTPTRTSPVSELTVLPPVVSQPTPVPTLVVLPTVVSQPTPAPTPFPDAQEIVDTVLGTGTSEHWANYLVSGSVTARGADERLALVGNIGDHNEVRWVVVGQAGEGWRLRGTSECLGSGFDAPPSFDLPPDLLDFDDDGRQEVLSHYSKTRGGRMISADTLYRWDGRALAPVWEAPTVVDGTIAGRQDVPQPYRAEYRAEWEWVDLDGAGLDEILLREHVAFYEPDEEGAVGDGSLSIGEESGERAFRWDGEAFRPYAPDSPDATFAYVAAGDVWLWQNHTARPLGAEHVREIQWSPDGRRIVWWAQPLVGGASGGLRRDDGGQAGVLSDEWSVGVALGPWRSPDLCAPGPDARPPRSRDWAAGAAPCDVPWRLVS